MVTQISSREFNQDTSGAKKAAAHAAAFDQRVFAVDTPVARRAAALHVPDPAPFRDALIGATALVHRMKLVTRDVKDFTRFDGLDIVDPWHP